VAKSNELGTTNLVTRDGVVRAVILDRIGPDRLTLSLIKASTAARYALVNDGTARVSSDIREQLVRPLTEV